MSIRENIQAVQTRIQNALDRSGRTREDVTLVTVTKTIDVVRIQEALEAGITHIGENKVQEAATKIETLQETSEITWHMIGHLQTNKVKRAVELFHMIHSVDSLRLAQEIHKRAVQQGKVMDVLFEVNVAEEDTKYGLTVEKALSMIREAVQFEGIAIKGLMTMAPFVADPEEARPYFRQLHKLLVRLQDQGMNQMTQLSMGMTNDFEVAVEEGATMVRIGSAIFGSR